MSSSKIKTSQSPSPPPFDDIDEDPFSHFLSPVMDEDDPFDGLEYSAGIHSSFDDEVEQKRTNFRARLENKWGSFMSSRRPSSPPRGQQQAPRTPPSEDQLPELMIDDLEGFGSPSSSPPLFKLPTLTESTEEHEDEELDGWESDRRTLRRKGNIKFDNRNRPMTAPSGVSTRPKAERPRFRRFRTLSGRPHSFIEPSPHLWTVEEQEEAARPELRSSRGRRWSRG